DVGGGSAARIVEVLVEASVSHLAVEEVPEAYGPLGLRQRPGSAPSHLREDAVDDLRSERGFLQELVEWKAAHPLQVREHRQEAARIRLPLFLPIAIVSVVDDATMWGPRSRSSARSPPTIASGARSGSAASCSSSACATSTATGRTNAAGTT